MRQGQIHFQRIPIGILHIFKELELIWTNVRQGTDIHCLWTYVHRRIGKYYFHVLFVFPEFYIASIKENTTFKVR
jgi:hypothetical protein